MKPGCCAARLAALLLAGLASGCNQNPFLAPQSRPWQSPQQPQPELAAQLRDQQRRLEQLDANNRDLHAQLAQSQQQARLKSDELELVKRQLAETAQQLKDQRLAFEQKSSQLRAMEASTRQLGGATITANNSAKAALKAVQVPGMQIDLDGDVVRIQLPADELFTPGTAQLKPTATGPLDQAATVIQNYYPRQRVAIEGHNDGGAGGANTDAHRLTSAWTDAVFAYLTQRSQIPARQLFTMSLGGNHPRYSNGTEAGRAGNRRVEIVIYPETVQ